MGCETIRLNQKDMQLTPVGARAFKTPDGIKCRMSKNEGNDWKLQDKLRDLGYPPILESVKSHDKSEIYVFSDWIEGASIFELQKDERIHEGVYHSWGQEMARIFRLGIAVKDVIPKNFVYQAKDHRVRLIDFNKLYINPEGFNEYEMVRDVLCNFYLPRELKDAFLDGYLGESTKKETPLVGMIAQCQDNYQDVMLGNDMLKKNSRSTRRCHMLRKEDLTGQRVLDVGCSHGILSRYAAYCKASKVVGVDKQCRGVYSRYKLVYLSAFLAYLEGLQNIIYYPHDIETKNFWDIAQNEPYDTVFFCAILGHIKGDRGEFMRKLESVTGKVLYYESNLEGKRDKTEDWLRSSTNFKTIEYLGDSGDADRGNHYAFFRCEK